jgi:hypothetical protein
MYDLQLSVLATRGSTSSSLGKGAAAHDLQENGALSTEPQQSDSYHIGHTQVVRKCKP